MYFEGCCVGAPDEKGNVLLAGPPKQNPKQDQKGANKATKEGGTFDVVCYQTMTFLDSCIPSIMLKTTIS